MSEKVDKRYWESVWQPTALPQRVIPEQDTLRNHSYHHMHRYFEEFVRPAAAPAPASLSSVARNPSGCRTLRAGSVLVCQPKLDLFANHTCAPHFSIYPRGLPKRSLVASAMLKEEDRLPHRFAWGRGRRDNTA